MKDKFVTYTATQRTDGGFCPCAICVRKDQPHAGCPDRNRCHDGYYVKVKTAPRKSKDRLLLESLLEQMTVISGHVYTMHNKGKFTLTPKQVSDMVRIKTKMEKV